MGISKVKITSCSRCGENIERRVYPDDRKYYCSKACHIADQKILGLGKNNSNFGRTWSSEKKEAASERTIKMFKENPQLGMACGKTNRGKKFSKERIRAMHKNNPTHLGLPHSIATKKKIGEKSKAKFTPEYKMKQRKTMEAAGRWTPLDQISPYKKYFKEAQWPENMIAYFSTSELLKFQNLGFWNVRTNKRGLIRDHILARSVGFEFQLPACLLRHPANLQLIPHGENVAKGCRDRKLSEGDKVKQIQHLIKKIQEYKGSWGEHAQCLEILAEEQYGRFVYR